MPTQYMEFRYDYRIDIPFSDWLETKDDEGWELVTVFPKDIGNFYDKHIINCIFRNKL